MSVAARGLAVIALIVASAAATAPREPGGATPVAAPGRHPIGDVAFLPDRDESLPGVRYGYGRGGFSVGVTAGAAVFAQRSAAASTADPKLAAFRMDVVGASADASLRGESRCAWRTNVYRGDDASAWREGAPNYARVRSRGVLPGVDVVYRAEGRRVAFDFEVAPGADPSAIAVAFAVGEDRAPGVRLEDDGSLVVASGAESMRFGAPVVYQDAAAGRTRVAGRYSLRRVENGGTEVAFDVGDYDRTRALVIDPPSLGSASYMGGTGNDNAIGAALGKNGEIYAYGLTTAPFFATNNHLGGTTGGSYDGYVAQIDGSGAVLANAVFGGSGIDYANAVSVAAATGDVFVAGLHVPQSGGAAVPFPVTQGAYAGPGGGTATTTRGFVLKLTPALTLTASATVACDGSMTFNGVSVANGHVALACETAAHNLPTTAQSAHAAYPAGAFGGVSAALVLSDDLTTPQFATYVGESYGRAYDCIWKGDGNLVVVGLTTGATLPVVNAPQATAGGGTDGWWAEYDGTLATVEVCTYVGGTGFDFLNHLARPSSDPSFASFAGDVFACGACSAAPSLALTTGTYHGGNDILVCAIRPNAAPLVMCGGGGGNELPTAIACTGDDLVTLCYTDSYGDYALIPELGPGGGPSDTGLNAWKAFDTNPVPDPEIDGQRWGSSLGDPSGGIVPGYTQTIPDGNLYLTSTTSGTDAIATAGAAQSVNASIGPSTDDGFVICISKSGLICPRPPAPTMRKRPAFRGFHSQEQAERFHASVGPNIYLRWSQAAANPEIVGFEVLERDVQGGVLFAEHSATLGAAARDLYVYIRNGSAETVHQDIWIRAVNACGARSKPLFFGSVDINKIRPEEMTAPTPDDGSIDISASAPLPTGGTFAVDGTVTGSAADADRLKAIATSIAGADAVVTAVTKKSAAGAASKKPAKVTFRFQGAQSVGVGERSVRVTYDPSGIVARAKVAVFATLNAKTKSLKFTLKPPK